MDSKVKPAERRPNKNKRKERADCLNLLNTDCEEAVVDRARTNNKSRESSGATNENKDHRSEGERRTNGGFLSSNVRHAAEE